MKGRMFSLASILGHHVEREADKEQSYSFLSDMEMEDEASFDVGPGPFSQQEAEVHALAQEELVFCRCIDKDHERKPVSWLETKENQTSMQYLSDAKRQAKTAGVGLALKKGKKNNLGLVGITLKTGEEGLVRKRWVVRGAPNMTPSTFQEFLEKQQWRLVDEIQPPNRRNGLWVFKGVSPIDLPSVGFVRNFGDSQMIFSPWIPKTQKTVSVPIEHKKSWATVVSENLGVTSNTPHQQQVPKDAEPPATIMDTQETGENEDHDMCTAKRTALDSPEGKEKRRILWTRTTITMVRAQVVFPLGTWEVMVTVASAASQR